MDLNKRYHINKNKLSYRIIEDEAVILDLDRGYYYCLNPVGTVIWKALEEEKDLGEILNVLKEEYQCPDEVIENDIMGFLSGLENEKII